MGKRVLLVEDEYLIRLWLADCLLETGFRVTEAEDGDQAIALMDGSEPFDLLITDIQLPGRTDGNAVARWAKQHCPGLPVIYSTGRCDSLRNELEACDALLAKPYTGATMLATAQRLLDAGHGPLADFRWNRLGRSSDAGIAAGTVLSGDAETALTAR
jgi:CheY-like chemotaxis protein